MNAPNLKVEEFFLSKESLSKEIETFVFSHQCGYLEAITEIANKKSIEFEIIGKYLSNSIVSKLEAEAQEMNLVKKTKNALPL